MKKIAGIETEVSLLLSQVLGIAFQSQFGLETGGKVDKWAGLGPDVFLFLEIENTQRHPDTNVVKLWPYLELHKRTRVFLIQAFCAGRRKVDSRSELAEWVAKKLEAEFPERFAYYKLVIQDQDQIGPQDRVRLPDRVKAFTAKASG